MIRPRVGVVPELRAGIGATLSRYACWAREGARMLHRRRRDKARGEATDQRLGVRLRDMFEAVGGTGVKIGQQLSMRIDLMPFDTCKELAKLVDAVPPFPTEEAIAIVEARIGSPLRERFRSFDPEPIGSASLACVYQAELTCGRRVAVKVKRPGVEALFASDLEAISTFTRALEALGVVREQFFVHLREGLQDMFLEELDFAQEARLQRTFRCSLIDHGPRWLSVPRVVTELSGSDVLVSEFADGVSCVQVLEATEAGGQLAASFLRESGVNPRRLARRVLLLSMWSQNEATLYHADPHPGNLIIQPGDRIALVDFGACGWTNERTQLYQRRVIERIRRKDPDGVAQVNLKQAEPMPRVDYPEYRRLAEGTFQRWLLGGEDPKADWWERSTARVWVEFTEHTQRHNIPMTADMLRLIRCTLLYDTIATRLDPKIDVELVHAYFLRAQKRRAKRGVSPLRMPLVPRAWEVAQGRGERLEQLLRLPGRIEVALPSAGVPQISQQAFVDTVSVAVRNGLIACLLLAVIAVLGSTIAPEGLTTASLVFAGFVAALLAVRRVRVRLSDTHESRMGGGLRRRDARRRHRS